ncbi:UBX domain-containing protein 4 [Betta splendens]|uniref:UBX domain-containing protein 4 n=1 Tax=Betta splendens TaxID=158456 RepID=A0A6P7LFK3_BETSP|nr:UBX domain-containing protein 4 [Betta splendens]
MLWFEGSIREAINAAKQRSFVFVVVIIGEDEQSVQLLSTWENDKVSEAVDNCCVAIKVDAKSETCLQFSQIYPVVCIPSSFFIGENGIPLEVIAGNVSSEELTKRINRVKQVHIEQIGHGLVLPETRSPVESLCDSTATEQATASAAPISSAAIPTESATPQTAKDPPSCPAMVNLACSNTEENRDSEVERLTTKLEAKREEKKRGEEQNEIKKEMERRKTGMAMQGFKRKQEEEKTKQILEERNREKAEDKAAKERVKQQIAMDRADRAARYAQTKEMDKTTKERLMKEKQAENEARKETLLKERSVIARIQFRLPDGSSFTNQFSSQSKLHEAMQFAVQKVGSRYGNFSLATMFPRREFTTEDLNKTFQELELAPSASIVLIPSGRTAKTLVQSSGGGIWALLGTLLYSPLAIWRFLSSFLFAAPAPSGVTFQGPAQDSRSHSTSASRDKEKRETLAKHTAEKQSKDFKKSGKICTLRNQDDSEDDNNTWNGNSTQQM